MCRVKVQGRLASVQGAAGVFGNIRATEKRAIYTLCRVYSIKANHRHPSVSEDNGSVPPSLST